METLVQITGVQYACEGLDVATVMEQLEERRPEVLLVTEQTHDFGIIVRALTGTECRGVVSRFDLEHVLAMMRHDDSSVLVGHVAETDREGRCFNVRIEGDYPTPLLPSDPQPDLWNEWSWTGAPLMDDSQDDRLLSISLKVALSELRRTGRMNKQTLLDHLRRVPELALWDVSHETQAQLGELRQLLSHHPDPDVRALAPRLRHALTALGSKGRIREFQDTLLPRLSRSAEAEQMHRLWSEMHRGELSDVKQWQPTIRRTLEAIDACLMQLPADLRYQKDQFGLLMHRLLYLSVPRRKLLMILSAFVLRRRLRSQIGLPEDSEAHVMEEVERQLILSLAPVFYGNTDDAEEFLILAKGQTNLHITQLTNLWIKSRRICPDHCHRPLWKALHDAGIYTASESNWNGLIENRRNWG